MVSHRHGSGPYETGRLPSAGAPIRNHVGLRLGSTTAAVILLSLLIHGVQAGALGLYWDDALQLLQPFQGVDHQPIAFVLTDTSQALRSERPFAFVAFALTRLAFLQSVAAAHWVLLGLLTINALAMAAVARRLVDREWFGFAAAAIFLTYPLAPLQPLWLATVHYQVGCLLMSTSILCLDHGATGLPARSRWLSVGGFAAYLGCLTTHEGLALIPPVFFALRLAPLPGATTLVRRTSGRLRRHPGAGRCLAHRGSTLVRRAALPTIAGPVRPRRVAPPTPRRPRSPPWHPGGSHCITCDGRRWRRRTGGRPRAGAAGLVGSHVRGSHRPG